MCGVLSPPEGEAEVMPTLPTQAIHPYHGNFSQPSPSAPPSSSRLLRPPHSYGFVPSFHHNPTGIPYTNSRLVNSDVKNVVETYLVDRWAEKKQSGTLPIDCDVESPSKSFDKDMDVEDVAEKVEDESDNDESALITQMKAYKQLKEIVPYHLLSVESKLTMLEYLIDELMGINVISAELFSRRNIKVCYLYLFGKIPSSTELDLTNDDECSIFALEGELLCCDGCTSSYHRRCINIPQFRFYLCARHLYSTGCQY